MSRHLNVRSIFPPKVELSGPWSTLMQQYSDDHLDPVNQACHTVGIPLIAGSLPVAATVVGLPLAAAMFTVGWGFQFVGHAFEGKQPSFVKDRRQLLVGLMWWTKKVGLPIVHTRVTRADSESQCDGATPIERAAA